MKVLITALLCTLASIISDQATPESAIWMTNMTEAQQAADEQGRDILLVFSGSDWCGPCIKLEKEIWMTPAFQSYAESDLVLVKADFPRKKKNALSDALQKQNDALAEKYNPQGYFPLVLRLDSEGAVLGKLGYKSISPEEYIEALEQFKK